MKSDSCFNFHLPHSKPPWDCCRCTRSWKKFVDQQFWDWPGWNQKCKVWNQPPFCSNMFKLPERTWWIIFMLSDPYLFWCVQSQPAHCSIQTSLYTACHIWDTQVVPRVLGHQVELKKCFKKCGQKLACASHDHVLGWEIRKNINTAWKWTSNRKKWYWSVGKRNTICEPNHL